MAKNGSKSSKPRSAPSKAASKGSWTKRDAATGQFVLGRAAFASISAVEGVYLSKSMKADLGRLESVSASERRRELSGKYGKKK